VGSFGALSKGLVRKKSGSRYILRENNIKLFHATLGFESNIFSIFAGITVSGDIAVACST